MTIQYAWQFPALDVTYSDGELQNVVTAVHWRLTATEDQHSASTYGSVGVGTPTPEAFVSYEDLTEEEVISWVTTALGGEDSVQAMKDGLASQIETQKAPKTGTMTPPWTPVYVQPPVVEPEVAPAE
jgi:hypothetical protein